VRPSSGAETLENETAFEVSDALEPAEIAAAEDGRTPINRYRNLFRFKACWPAEPNETHRGWGHAGPRPHLAVATFDSLACQGAAAYQGRLFQMGA